MDTISRSESLSSIYPVCVRDVSVGGVVTQPRRREGDGGLLRRAQVHPDGPADHAVAEDERDQGHEEVRDREPRDVGLKMRAWYSFALWKYKNRTGSS